MDFVHVLGHRSDIFLPELREVSVILLLYLQTVAVRMHEKSEGRHHVEGVPGDHKHLLGFRCRWIAGHGRRRRICDPNSIRIASDARSKHAHLCFHESPLDIHVAACVNTSDLLQVATHVCAAAPWEVLEGNPIAEHITFPIQEVAFATCCDLL